MSEQRSEKILVVDDNPATLYSTARVLRGAGFHVLEAESGLSAVERARAGVDLIVLDVNLPDIDGFEVCRRVRSDPSTARLPVIHLSATFVQDTDKVHGLEVGADGYLTHPVEPPVLVATVNAFLRTRQAEDAMRRSEARFKAVFENALNGIALVNEDQIYLDANPAMCALLGLPREGIVGKHASVFIPADHKAAADAAMRALDADGSWRGHLPLIRSDGRTVQLDWSISRHSMPGVRLAVVTDVTDRLAIEKEREQLLASERAAREEAERANRIKDDFLATLSHELRTPLNAIVGWSQVLRTPSATKDDLADGLESIERNARVQAQLIDDLLDVARITSGKLRLEVQPVDPAAVVDAALQAVAPAARAKGIALHSALDPHAGSVAADASRLQQVVWNLVNNAVKFTPQGGRIDVRLTRAEGRVEITVADNGQGVHPDLLPHLFERFRQGDARTTRTPGGLGLGLAIVKQLVEMHGGTVTASSEGEGRGASFTVTLPVSSPTDPADRKSPRGWTPPGDAGGATGASGGCHSEALTGDPARPPQFTPLDGVRVLVVDDEADARDLMKRLLRECSASVANAKNVADALELIDAFRPHVLVSDIGMPQCDGYDLIRLVRARGHTPQSLPAVALTAFARPEDRLKAVQAGYQVHVAKPVNASELSAVIANLVGKASR
jgi:PAS domain S-box-containing protein